jgi:acyl carrier protein
MVNVQEVVKRYIVDNILFGEDGRLTEDTSFQRSGILDSTGFLGLITFTEEKFGIKIADEEVVPENFDTLRKISAFVERKKDGVKAAS